MGSAERDNRYCLVVPLSFYLSSTPDSCPGFRSLSYEMRRLDQIKTSPVISPSSESSATSNKMSNFVFLSYALRSFLPEGGATDSCLQPTCRGGRLRMISPPPAPCFQRLQGTHLVTSCQQINLRNNAAHTPRGGCTMHCLSLCLPQGHQHGLWMVIWLLESAEGRG